MTQPLILQQLERATRFERATTSLGMLRKRLNCLGFQWLRFPDFPDFAVLCKDSGPSKSVTARDADNRHSEQTRTSESARMGLPTSRNGTSPPTGIQLDL
jgi:hypothetical protein